MIRLSTLAAFILILASLPAMALTELDMRITADELRQAGFVPADAPSCVSIQACALYEMTGKGPLREMGVAPRKRFHVSVTGPVGKATVFYYEFDDGAAAERAQMFVRANVWGGDQPTPRHPERIYRLDNYIVIVSSPIKDALDDLLVQRLITTPVPVSLIDAWLKRLPAGPSGFDTPRGVFEALRRGDSKPLEAGAPLFGRAWEINPDGVVTRSFIEVLDLRPTEGRLAGYWAPVKPDNDEERVQLEAILTQGRKGEKPVIPAGLMQYLGTLFPKGAQPLFLRDGVAFLKQGGNVAMLRRVREGVVLIVATEHWTGKPSPVIIAMFWGPR